VKPDDSCTDAKRPMTLPLLHYTVPDNKKTSVQPNTLQEKKATLM